MRRASPARPRSSRPRAPTAEDNGIAYPTKLKASIGPPTILTYTTAAGEISSGHGKDFLEDLIKERSALQGMQATGQLSPMVWATRKAYGVHFSFVSLNLTERRRVESVDASRFEELVQLSCASTASEARGSIEMPWIQACPYISISTA